MKKIFLAICIVLLSCNSCPETESIATSCFKNFSTVLTNNKTQQLNFSELIDCFEWNRLEIHSKSNHEAYPCFKFHQINKINGIHLDDKMDWLDSDDWYFVHFYQDEQLVPEILVISESIVSFENLTQNKTQTPSFTKTQADFYVTKIIYGGIEGKEMLKQRQVIKLP